MKFPADEKLALEAASSAVGSGGAETDVDAEAGDTNVLTSTPDVTLEVGNGAALDIGGALPAANLATDPEVPDEQLPAPSQSYAAAVAAHVFFHSPVVQQSTGSTTSVPVPSSGSSFSITDLLGGRRSTGDRIARKRRVVSGFSHPGVRVGPAQMVGSVSGDAVNELLDDGTELINEEDEKSFSAVRKQLDEDASLTGLGWLPTPATDHFVSAMREVRACVRACIRACVCVCMRINTCLECIWK